MGIVPHLMVNRDWDMGKELELMDVYHVMGHRIRSRRMELDYSQSSVASWIAVSPQTLCNIETGKTKMSLDSLLRICKALKIDPGSILPDHDEYNLRDWKYTPRYDKDILNERKEKIIAYTEKCSLRDAEVILTVFEIMHKHRGKF